MECAGGNLTLRVSTSYNSLSSHTYFDPPCGGKLPFAYTRMCCWMVFYRFVLNRIYNFAREPITRSEQLPYSAFVTAFLRTSFFFRHILGHFFPRQYNLHHVYERIRNIRYGKGKLNVIKRQKYHFLNL